MTHTKRISLTIGAAIIAVIFLAIALCVTLYVSVDIFLGGCLWWECAPDRSFDVLDLGLPLNLFPVNTVYSPIYLRDDDDPETYRSGDQTFRWGNGYGGGIYIVDTYSSTRNASARFASGKKSFFKNWGDTEIHWSKPEELTYVSPFADEFFIACGRMGKEFGSTIRCGVIAQYQEFVVFFNADLVDGMSYQEFQNIVIYMDEQISSYLYKK